MKCTETARILVPWGGKILSYCPVHANEIITLGELIDSPVRVKLIENSQVECESKSELTEEEKGMNMGFELLRQGVKK